MKVNPVRPCVFRGFRDWPLIETGWALPCLCLNPLELFAERDAIFVFEIKSKDGGSALTNGFDQAAKGRLGSPSARSS